MEEKAIGRHKILVRRNDAAIRQCSALVTWKNGSQFWREWRTEEKVSILREPELFSKFLYVRVIQGHSGSTINRALQDNALLPEGFTDFLITSETENNLGQRWIVVWLQEESFSKQADKLCSSPMWIRWIIKMASWETLCDLSQTRIAPYRNTWKYFQDTLFLVQLEARPTKRTCNFIKQDQTQSFSTTHCLQSSLRKRCTMKTKDQLYQRESVILRPRVVLRADSQTGSQDLLVQEARSSWEGSQQDAKGYKETRSNTADFRIPGISSSTVKLHDARRQNHVTKLIEMFEKQQHKKHFLKDMSHKQEINRFITKILEDMSSTVFETFREFCKTSTSSLLFRDGNRVSLLQLRFYFNPWLCHQEEFQSRTKARPIWKTDHVSSRRRRCTRKRDSQSTSNMEDTDERRWFGRTNIISRPCSFVLHSTRMSDQQGYCGQLQKCFSKQGFLLGLLKNPETKATVKPDAETISSWFFWDMEGHAKKCVDILRICE